MPAGSGGMNSPQMGSFSVATWSGAELPACPVHLPEVCGARRTAEEPRSCCLIRLFQPRSSSLGSGHARGRGLAGGGESASVGGRLFWEELNAMFEKPGREHCGNELPEHWDFGWAHGMSWRD